MGLTGATREKSKLQVWGGSGSAVMVDERNGLFSRRGNNEGFHACLDENNK